MAATTDIPALIVNADDFGLTEGINRGIIEAFAAGALTSTSIMVGMPAFEDAVQRARSAGEGLGVGLHFTLTAGRPLTRASTLIDGQTGSFADIKTIVLRAIGGRIRQREVEEECAAQIARARESGLQLTHLDSHQHVHLLPSVRTGVERVLVAERVPAVRRPLERLTGIPEWRRRLPSRLIVRVLAETARIGRWPARTTDHFLGHALFGSPDFLEALPRALSSLGAGSTELMVHPGYVPGPLPGGDPYTTQREVELRALLSPGVLRRMHDRRIRLVHFGNL